MGRKMKDSGIEWIGEIPEEWSLCHIKNIGSTSSGATPLRSKEKDYFADADIPWIRTLDLNDGEVFDCSERITQEALESSSCSIMPVNTVCVAMYGGEGTIGKCGLLRIEATTNQAVCSIVCGDRIIPEFMLYHLIAIRKYWMFFAVGTRKDPNISQDIVGRMKIALPTVMEQRKIAVYLGNVCREVDTAIKKATDSVEAYKSLKQSLITRAVTKGIRDEREMKDSGIEWIGDIPQDWKFAQLGRFVTIFSGISVGRVYPQGTELVEVPYLRVANVQGEYVDLSDVAAIKVTRDEAEKYKLHAGSLLMTEGGDRDKLGRGTLWKGEIENCIHQNHVFEVRPNDALLVRFLDYITTSDVARIYFDITAKKTTNLACTNKTTILKFKLPVPEVSEQQEIVYYLDEKCSAIDTLIAKKEQLLSELETYKKSLIYEYVTGKREVPA